MQPYLALGRGLSAEGHAVRLVASPRYETAAHEAGLQFSAVVNTDPFHALDFEEGQRWRAGRRGLVSLLQSVGRVTSDGTTQRFADCWSACLDADAIIVSPLALFIGASVAEKLRVPLVRAFYCPLTPTREYPTVLASGLPALPGFLNRWTHYAASRLVSEGFRKQIDRARREVLALGPLPSDLLAELDRRHAPLLYGYSAEVCPRPADWGGWVVVTGYWFLPPPDAWQPPDDLVAFLESGPPPVYIGFGSMADAAPAQAAAAVSEALEACGLRGVIGAGWAGLRPGATSSGVHVVGDVPHAWLFPRMAAVVHHGGAGTTAAGLRAGVPTVTVPFGMPDQPFWGRRLRHLGVGVGPIPRRRLTARRLVEALTVVTTDAGMKERAAALGRRIRGEDGVARAVEAFTRLMAAGAVHDPRIRANP